jgi:hypothetical protein
VSIARDAEQRLRHELAIDRVSSTVKSDGRFEADIEAVLKAVDKLDRCMVKSCEKTEDLSYLEPIYAEKVNEPGAVVCRSVLCREHAAMLSWSI